MILLFLLYFYQINAVLVDITFFLIKKNLTTQNFEWNIQYLFHKYIIMMMIIIICVCVCISQRNFAYF